MTKRLVRVYVDIELREDVADLVSKVSGRAHTIDGVANAWDGWMEEIHEIGERTADHLHEVKDPLPVYWRPFRKLMEWLHK